MSELNQPIPMLDLSDQFQTLEAEWLAAIRDTGGRGSFILGPNVSAFEKEIAEYVGVSDAVAVANGTDALLLSLRALDIGPGDEVITTPFTFFATAEVITLAGATPVFVDIDESSFNMDVTQVMDRITSRTRAILPVHIFGYPMPMGELMALARERGLGVVEDCAQAFGASDEGRRVGGIGDTGCFSFYPTKVLGGYGDGGMISTNNSELATSLRQLRNHGASAPFMHDRVGYNSRLDEIQAALLRIKLRGMGDILAGRKRVADGYDRGLAGLDLQTPGRPDNGQHVFNLYTLRSPQRDRIRQGLMDAQIGSAICYPLGLHLQAVYKELNYQPGDLPVCEGLSSQVLSLPIFPEMSDAQVERVCQVIGDSL
ncbi:MAG TPA: DegT/DnrJ/EryC1/StrS family aminotransferase [Acidiferrobacteraceae bacterium]|nr:DegT/DnrJ/EryC1/StrS family aminotransferase [Acidiferrobacteraceae bacterium]